MGEVMLEYKNCKQCDEPYDEDQLENGLCFVCKDKMNNSVFVNDYEINANLKEIQEEFSSNEDLNFPNNG